MKRGTDHNWEIVKFNGDIALYALCKCGFRYPCSSSTQNTDGSWSPKQEVTKIYPYCPLCGARKKRYSADVVKLDRYSWE